MKLLEANAGKRALVFVDGDHAKEVVKQEAETLWENHPTLPILFHDTYVDPIAPSAVNGPGLAIRGIVSQRPHDYVVVETSLGRPGMTLVIPKGSSE